MKAVDFLESTNKPSADEFLSEGKKQSANDFLSTPETPVFQTHEEHQLLREGYAAEGQSKVGQQMADEAMAAAGGVPALDVVSAKQVAEAGGSVLRPDTEILAEHIKDAQLTNEQMEALGIPAWMAPIERGAVSAAGALASPENVLYGGIGAGEKTVGKVLGAAFTMQIAPQIASKTLEGAADLARGKTDEGLEKLSEAAALTAPFAGAHVVSKLREPNLKLSEKPLPNVEEAAIKGGIPVRESAIQLLDKAEAIKDVAPLTAEALAKVAAPEGDAAKLTELTKAETLTPEQQAEKSTLEAKSTANNSKEAWTGMGFEGLKKEEPAPTEFKPAKLERPWDIIDELKNSFGSILNKKSSKPGHEGYYDEGYKNASSGSGRELFSATGSGPDEALDHLIQNGMMGKDSTVGDMWNAIDRASGNRRSFANGELPEQKADAFHSAMSDKMASKDKQVLSVGDLGVGDKFTLKGEQFRVTAIDPDTGEVHVQDGKKFGAQTIPEGADLAIDKRSHDKAEVSNDTNDPLSDNYQPEMVGMGGAVPGEFENSPKTPSGIKNATVDAERTKRGLPAAVEPARRSFGAVWDEAMADIDRNPDVQQKLIDELRNKPRALTDHEDALILQRQIDLQNEFGKATRDLAQAHEDGRMDAVAQEKVRIAGLSDQLLDLYNIGKESGTETGRGLNARKMMANEDFSLAQMELSKRSVSGGRPLSDTERADIQKLHDKINETQKAYDEYVAKTDEKISDMEAQHAHDKLVQESEAEKNISPHIFKIAERIVSTLDRRADAARVRLKERLGRTSAGLDPTILIDLAEIGAAHISHIGLDFAKWSAKMVSEFGDVVKPHLDDIWKESQRTIDELGDKMGGKKDAERLKRVTKKMDPIEKREILKESITSKFEEGKTDISGLVHKLARTFVEQGIKGRDELIDAVHQFLKELDPKITRRETMDAISGYGKFSQLSKDAISVELRDLKGQMQQVGKLEDMQAKKAPQKTGVERREPSDEERRLIQQVNEMKKKGGFTVTDPAKQLKGALDSIKTRLRNQISDLGHQITTGTKIVKGKTPVPYDAEATKLKTERDALKEQFDSIFGKKGLTDDQRIAAAKSAVEKSIAEYDRRIKENDLNPAKKVSTTPVTPELEALRARRDALKVEFEHLQELANPKKTPEEIALKAMKTRLANRTAELQGKLAVGDFNPRARKPAATMDAEATRLKVENERVKQEFKKGLLKDRYANRTNLEKVSDTFVKWRRAFVLSGPVTLAKLTSAAAQRMVITPTEEFLGGAIGKLPGVRDVAARAPREGGFNAHAEAKAITEGFTKGMRDAWQLMKTGKSDLEVLYGKETGIPHTAVDFIGSLHGALKTVTKRAEFTRSLEKRMEFNIRKGVDVTDPLVQTRISMEAYKDAQRSIFLQDNRVVSAYKRALRALEEPNRATGKPSVAGKLGATAFKMALPVVKVPTNIVGEALQYAVGTVTGSTKLALALKSGVEKLHPEEADMIMRHLKKGSLGAAMMLAGYLMPQIIGGYYQSGRKQDKKDVPYGEIKVGGHEVPKHLLHNPMLENLQIGATIRHVADSKLRKKDKDTQGVPAGIMAAALGLADEVPFIREQTELAKMHNPYERGPWLGYQAKSFVVPQGVQWLAEHTDTDKAGNMVKRKPETALEFIESGIPGLRKIVPKKK